MACSFIMINRAATVAKVTHSGKKTTLAHGNPAGEGPGIGKYSTKVRNSGPISDVSGKNH